MSAITFMTELMSALERVRALLRQREEAKHIADALMLEGSQKIDELHAQLAASQARCAQLEAFVAQYPEGSVSTLRQWYAMKQELTTAQARIEELELALTYKDII